jgi:BASS family bile acid:Na+ symporter
MQTLIEVVIPLLNFLLLTAVGMDLTAADFARVRRQRALVLAGLLVPPIVLPLAAVGLIAPFDVSPAVATGVLLIAACPIGGISNAYSYLARASTALSVTLTALSCLFASVTIPAVSHGLELLLGRQLDFVAPLPLLFVQLTLMLGLPVALGMWIRVRSPHWAARLRPALQRMSFTGVGVLFALVILDDVPAFVGELAVTVPLTAAFVVVSLIVGWATAVPLSRDPRDRFTFAAEFGTRNIGVALTIAVAILGRVEFARVATAYALVEIPILLGLAAAFRRWVSPALPSSTGGPAHHSGTLAERGGERAGPAV